MWQCRWGGCGGSGGVHLGGSGGCDVCLCGSGGHGVCWGGSHGFCQYASRGIVCWASVGSEGDSSSVSGSSGGIVGVSCVCSWGGDDISNSGCVSGGRCSVSSGCKSYVSSVIVFVIRFSDSFYD